MRTLMALANRILGRLVLSGADHVVFISKQVQEYFESMLRFRRPPAFIPNGVDTAVFRPVAETERQVEPRQQRVREHGDEPQREHSRPRHGLLQRHEADDEHERGRRATDDQRGGEA
jgi:glycosyltransferase involved in cell wall biosynthesis